MAEKGETFVHSHRRGRVELCLWHSDDGVDSV